MTTMPRTRELCTACALAGLMFGAVTALGQDVDNPTVAELAVQQAEGAMRVALLQRDLRRHELEAARVERRAGIETDMTVALAEVALRVAEQALAAAQIDLEEVEAAGRPVRREATAPRVGGRDFVSERWRMELDVIEGAAPAHEERVRLAAVRVRAGVGDPEELAHATLDRERLFAAADRIRGMLTLRSRFLAGEIGAEEVELRQRILLETERERVLRVELADAQAGHLTAQ